MLKKMSYGFAIILAFLSFAVTNAQSKESDNEKSKTETHHKMNDEKADVNPWNEVCPVKGNKVSSATPVVEYNEKSYGFCCPGCDKKFEKEPEKYSKNLSEDGKKFLGKK